MNDGKVEIAAGLVPLMRWLYKAGIISVGGGADSVVHVTEEFFRETFPVYDVSERDKGYSFKYELSYKWKDVLFIALSDNV